MYGEEGGKGRSYDGKNMREVELKNIYRKFRRIYNVLEEHICGG